MLKRNYEVNPERADEFVYKRTLPVNDNDLSQRLRLQTQGKLLKAYIGREVFDFELGSSDEEDDFILKEICVMHDTQSRASGGFIVDNRGLFKSSTPPARPDYSTSIWAQMLKNDKAKLLDDTSREARRFRRCFRVPYKLFIEVMVPQCKEESTPIFSDDFRKFRVPVEIKLLIALRILGRDACADDCRDLSLVSDSTCNRIFKQFINNYSKYYYSKYVRFPESDSKELYENLETYRLLGFPGCLGSIDATHIFWEKCPHELHFRCTGKEGEPSLVFQCAVSHNRFVYHISKGFVGSYCDITTIKHDQELLHALMEQYKDVEYIVYDSQGTARRMKGLWFLSDNGYPTTFSMLIRPILAQTSPLEFYFSEFVESARKDIECFFGITKQRFRFLKNAIRYHNPLTIENAFKVAGVLHNMLLSYDHYINASLEDIESTFTNLCPNKFDYTAQDNAEDEADADFEENVVRKIITFPALFKSKASGNYILNSFPSFTALGNLTLSQTTRIFVQNFNYQFQIGELFWPKGKRRLAGMKTRLGDFTVATSQAALLRLKQLVHHHLYVTSSSHKEDGTGIFSKVDIYPDTPVAHFLGKVVVESAYTSSRSKSDYLQLPKGNPPFYVKYDDALDRENCFASKAAYLPFNVETVHLVNCKLYVNPKSKEAFIYAIRFVPKDTEIVWI